MHKKIIKTALCFLLSALVLSGCSLLPKEEELQTAPVVVENTDVSYKTTFVLSGDLIYTTPVQCKYKPIKTETYSFDLAGVAFDTVYVSVGDYVEEGELLAQLDISGIENQLKTNRYNINTTNLSISQQKEMRELKTNQQEALIKASDPALAASMPTPESIWSGYTPQINTLSDKLTVLNIEREELLAQKESRQLIAKFSGNVTEASVKTNRDKSVQGEKIVTIADTTSSMFVASTKYHDKFEMGGLYDMEINGEICGMRVVNPLDYGIEDAPAESGQEAKVYFEVDGAVAGISDSGTGTINLVLGEADNALYVINEAVIDTPNGKMVYCFDENGVMTMKSVEIGLVTDKYTEIKSGVSAGEELILE